MVICLERGADLHMAQLMRLVPARPCSPGQRAIKWVLLLLFVITDYAEQTTPTLALSDKSQRRKLSEVICLALPNSTNSDLVAISLSFFAQWLTNRISKLHCRD